MEALQPAYFLGSTTIIISMPVKSTSCVSTKAEIQKLL